MSEQSISECAGGRQIALTSGFPEDEFWSIPCLNDGTDDLEMLVEDDVVRLSICRAHALSLQELAGARRIR